MKNEHSTSSKCLPYLNTFLFIVILLCFKHFWYCFTLLLNQKSKLNELIKQNARYPIPFDDSEENTIENIIFPKENLNFIPDIYTIMPTYKRLTEKSDLTSILQAIRLSNVKIDFQL